MSSRFLFFFFCLAVAAQAQLISEDELYTDDDRSPFDLGSSFSSAACYSADCIHETVKREAVEVETMKDYIKYLLRGNKTKDDHYNTDPFVYGNTTIGKSRQRIFYLLL